MSASGATPPSVTFAPPVPWPTPRVWKAYRLAIWVLGALLALHGASTLAIAKRALLTISKDTVPSIIAAEEIGYALADLDANVANALLGTPQHRQLAANTIEKERVTVTDRIIDAAENITYGDAERQPIRELTRNLGLYLERAAEARLRLEQGDAGGARATYWQATEILHKNLLVAAASLDAANKSQLEAAYESGIKETEGAEVVSCLLGAMLVAALITLEIKLARRTRRIISLPLVLATLLAMILPVLLAYRFTAARSSLRVAKADAFDSVHALIRARAIAYDLNGDESRFLLDPGDAHGFGAVFKSKVAQLTTNPLAPTPSTVELAVRKRSTKPKESGLFWDELDNLTFPGEYDTASRMVGGFRSYMTIDAKIRKLAASGNLPDAIELAIGDRPDESNAVFARMDDALVSTVAINRAAFDREMSGTEESLTATERVSIVLSLFIAGLTWLGLRPRLREYAE
jgi:hypothetical protein